MLCFMAVYKELIYTYCGFTLVYLTSTTYFLLLHDGNQRDRLDRVTLHP